MTKAQRLTGWPTLVLDGKEVKDTVENRNAGGKERFNGPHHDAKWARQLRAAKAAPTVVLTPHHCIVSC